MYERLATLVRLQEEASTMPNKKQCIVQWPGGNLKLSKKHFQIFNTLYNAPNQQMDIIDLEAAVWGEEVDVNLGTIKTAMCRLGIALTDANSPFLIESVLSKGGETMEISDRKGVRMVKTRPALVGYRLVFTKT